MNISRIRGIFRVHKVRKGSKTDNIPWRTSKEERAALLKRIYADVDLSKISSTTSSSSTSNSGVERGERQKSKTHDETEYYHNLPDNKLKQILLYHTSSMAFERGKARLKMLEDIVHSESKYMDIDPPNVRFDDLGPISRRGSYNNSINTIRFNLNAILSPSVDFLTLIETAIHETRHKYQHDKIMNAQIKGESQDQVVSFFTNAGNDYPNRHNYPSYEEYFSAYKNNALEVDANSYAKSRIAYFADYYSNDPAIFTGKAIERAGNVFLPDNIIKNQILMTPDSKSPDGVMAQPLVHNEFGGSKSMKHTTSFSPEAQKAILDLYTSNVKELQKTAETSIEKMAEMIKPFHYIQAQEAVNIMIRYYNLEMKAEILKAINNWRNSERSFVHTAKAYKAGDAAIQTARKLEDELVETFKNYVKNIPEINDDTSTPTTAPEAVEKCTNVLAELFKKMEVLREDIRKRITSKSEDNSLYSSISGMVDETYSNFNIILKGGAKTLEDLATELGATWKNMDEIGTKPTNPTLPNVTSLFTSKRRAFSGKNN